MMTGLLNRDRSCKVSSSIRIPGVLLLSSAMETALVALDRPSGVLGKTPIPFNRSSRRISLVASRPFITGSWMSIRTKWKPPWRHFFTASSPLPAHFQRTLSRFMNASRSFWLIILSSTISTLIGGTVPSIRPPKAALRNGEVLLLFLSFSVGRARGDDPRAGGVNVLCCGDSGGGGTGGVGTAGPGCDA